MSTRRAEWDSLLARCAAVGWRVEQGRNGHVKIYPPGNGPVIHTGPPGSGSSMLNIIARLRRAGLDDAEASRENGDRRAHRRALLRDRSTTQAQRPVVPQPVTQPSEESDEMVMKTMAKNEGDLGYVDGVAIVERAPAHHETPLSRGKYALRDGWELLLADGNVVYRCERAMNGDGTCDKVFGSAAGINAHQGQAHGRKTDAKKASKSVQVQKTTSSRSSANTVQTTRRKVKTPVNIADALTTIAEQLITVGKNVERIGHDIMDITKDLPDGDVVDKARRYDTLRSAMNGEI